MKFRKSLAISVFFACLQSAALGALVVHYTLDDNGSGAVSTTNVGSATHSWDGSSGATLTTGKFSGAGTFTTASDWWSNDNTGANLNNFTFSMHIKQDTPAFLAWQDFASIGDGNSSVFKFEFHGGNQGTALYTAGNPGGGSVGFDGTGPDVNDGAWHHLAMVSNGATLTLFVDGLSAGSGAYTGSGAIDALQLVGQFGGGRDQNAVIDDVALYDTALGAGQISWLGSNVAVANPVPEPSAALLGGLGALALLRRRRA